VLISTTTTTTTTTSTTATTLPVKQLQQQRQLCRLNNFNNSDNFAGSHATTLPARHMASMHSQMLMTTDSLWLTTGLT